MTGGRRSNRSAFRLSKKGVVGSVVAALLLSIGASGGAFAYWSASSVSGGGGVAAATNVNQGNTPTATATGNSVSVQWAASSLANASAVDGYVVARYDATTLAAQTVLSGCSGKISSTTCTETGVPDGRWVYTITPVKGTNWLGTASTASVAVRVDVTSPTNSITLGSVTGAAKIVGSTIYYRGVAAGSFSLVNAVADSGSGPASSSTTSLAGTTTGWTHAPSTVTTPAGGPYTSSAFTWSAATTSSPNEIVTGADLFGNTVTSSLSFVNDSTAPAASISYADGDISGSTVSVSFTTGTDSSGIGTRLLQRASAPLAGMTCGGTYSAFATVANGTNPTSPFTDTVGSGSCYKYQYVVTDALGNQSTATSPNVAHSPYGAFWNFETPGSTTDKTGNRNDGTLQPGATVMQPGKNGSYALNLSGANNSFMTAPATVIDTSQSFTVSAWVKPSNTTGFRTFVSMDGVSASGFYLQINGGAYAFTFRGADSTTSGETKVSGPLAVSGTWTHLAGVYDKAAQTIKLYVNGVLQGTVAYSSAWKATGVTAIGRGLWNGGPVDFFAGSVDDVRLFDSALSASQVAVLAQ